MLPTGWNCLGLVHHLTLDVERFWFQNVMAGTPLAAAADGESSSAWQVPADMSAADVLGLYRDEIARANEIIEATPLEQAPARKARSC